MLVIPGGKTISVLKFHMETFDWKRWLKGEKITRGEFHEEMRGYVGNTEGKNDFRGELPI